MVGQLLALVMYAFHFSTLATAGYPNHTPLSSPFLCPILGFTCTTAWWSSAGYGTTAFVIASAIDRAQNVAFLFLLVYIMKGW